MIKEEGNYVLGLDVSTKTIGIALFEDKGTYGELKLLHHISPLAKPKVDDKLHELFLKANIFEKEFLSKYIGVGIKKVIIEEPLLRSNNVHTVATLLRFNGMVSKAVYEVLGVVPVFISSYDARAYAFPELLAKRKYNKKGENFTESEIAKKKPVLFGDYPYEVDKKEIIWKKVADLEPKIDWLYDKKKALKKECFDMTDSYCATIGYMKKIKKWN